MCWLVLALLVPAGDAGAAPAPSPGAPSPQAPAPGAQTVTLDPGKVQPGGDVKILGGGWTPGALVQISVCGENALAGSASCAQQTAVSVTVGNEGTISATLPVAAPPKPCPCVVRVATVTGGRPMHLNTQLEIEGAPFAPLPEQAVGPGRLVFINSRLAGGDSLFTWFGSPVSRRFEIEVGNMGHSSIVNPTFRIGTYEGVFAPSWDDVRWQGTILPGQRATIRLPIELEPRQHGDFGFRVTYGDQVVDEQALSVGRPWGVYVFVALLVVVVPLTVWRLGGRLIEAIREVRQAKTKERERDVGLPGAADAAENDDRAAAVRQARPLRLTPAPREPDPVVVGGATPARSVAEPLVVAGPLFSGSADTAATVTTAATPDTAAGTTADLAADATADLAAGRSIGPDAPPSPPSVPEPAPEGPTASRARPEAPTRVLPAVPAELVRPEDVVRGLAWGSGAGPGGSGGEDA